MLNNPCLLQAGANVQSMIVKVTKCVSCFLLKILNLNLYAKVRKTSLERDFRNPERKRIEECGRGKFPFWMRLDRKLQWTLFSFIR